MIDAISMMPDNDLQPSNNLPQDLTPGSALKQQRLLLGLSLADVSGKLKLAPRQIEALEADDYRALPGNTFVRGFVRNYARLLHLDPHPMLSYLEQNLPTEAQQAALPRLREESMPMLRLGDGAGQLPSLLVVLATAVVVLLVFGAYWIYQGSSQEPQLTLTEPQQPSVPLPQSKVSPAVSLPPADLANQPPVSASGQPITHTPVATPLTVPPPVVQAGGQNEPSSPLAPVAAPQVQPPLVQPAPQLVVPPAKPPLTPPQAVPGTEPAPPAVKGGELKVVAKADSWVQITDASGARLVNEIVAAGQSRTVSGIPPYRIKIGNGRQTELYYKGKPTDLNPHIKVDVASLELN